MTWTQQLMHVFRRDLRHFRWYVAAYAITVALLVARVYRIDDSIGGFNASLLLLLVGLGMFLVAVAIQADPPTADDAMWRAMPLEPTAVFGAKFALIGLLLVIGLVGQFAALRAYALGTADIAAYLLQSIVPMSWWLVGSMLIAAHTRDARWYITVLVTAPIAFAILMWFSSSNTMFGMLRVAENANDPAALFAFLRVLALVAAFVVLILSYMRRIGRRASTGAAAVMLIVGGVVGATNAIMSGSRMRGPVRLFAPDVRVRAALAIDVTDSTSATVSVRVTDAELAVSDRLLFESPVVVMQFPDSSAVRLPLRLGMHEALVGTPYGQTTRSLPSWGTMVVAEPTQVAGTGAPWPLPRFSEHRFTVASSLTEHQRRAIDSGTVQAWIEAEAQLVAAHVAADVPSVPGALTVVPGLRVAVAENRRGDPRNRRVDRIVHLSTMRPAGEPMDDQNGGDILAVLLGRAPGQSMVLSEQAMSLGDDLVLPGVSRSSSAYSLTPTRWSRRVTGSGAAVTRDSMPAWLDSARVVVLRWENARVAKLTSDRVRLLSTTLPAVRGVGEAMSVSRAVPLND